MRPTPVGLVLALAAASWGCGSEQPPSGDAFPILAERAGGGFVLHVGRGNEPVRTAVIEVLSPITVFDADPAALPVRGSSTVTLLARRSDADPTLVARAQFDTKVLEIHPCADGGPCTIGLAGQPVEIQAVIGADTLRGDAIRFEPAASRMFVLPSVAGDSEARDRACEVEVPSPFYGGGTLQVGGTELGFDGLRVALGVCLSPDPTASDPTDRGTDAALVLSTGMGLSLLGRARYDAWATATGAPVYDDLPPATALLPSGPIDGRLGRIDRLAIVGTASAPRGACREVYAHHLLSERDCPADGSTDCPCSGGKSFCAIGAVMELSPPDPIDVVVIDDLAPLLQALRAELRPDQPEIDGILGVNALATAAFDIDYPANRALFRCVDPGCVARPALRSSSSRTTIATCLAGAPPPPVDAAVDAPAVDAAVDAAIDAPAIDAPAIDAPAIDAPAIDAPIDGPVADAALVP